MNMTRKNFLQWSAITTGGLVFGTALPACGGGGGGSNSASGTSAILTASVAASRVSGVAPLYVNFDATATTSTLSTNPSHELFFAHTFGDTGAGLWANGVQSAGLTSKNAGYGPVTGHVYETPGTYTYTMAVTDGVNTATRTKTIVVEDPDVVYAGTKTICISHSGSILDAPYGAQMVNTLGNTDMYAAFNTYKASNKRILFCKADSWTCTAQLTFTNLAALTLSGYGTGALPTFGSGSMVSVTPSALNASMFSVQSGNSDLRICNFKIAADPTTFAGALDASIVQMLFYKVEIRGCAQGFNAFNGVGVGVNRVFDQSCYYECLVDGLYGTPFVDYISGSQLHGGIGAFVSLVRGGVMGCYFDSCNHGEQTLRLPYVDRAHINNNYIARPNQTKNVLKLHSFIYSETPLYSEKFVISGNMMDLRGGYSYGAALGGTSISTGLTTVSDVGTCSMVIGNGGGSGDERVRNGIVENNFTYGCLGNPKSLLAFAEVNCPNVTVRNNIADFSVGDRTTTYSGPYINTYMHMVTTTTSTLDQTVGVRVYNNTMYSNLANAEYANFVRVSPPASGKPVADQITVKNNLWYAPFHSVFNRTAVYNHLGTGTTIVASNNTDNVATLSVSPAFLATPPVALADWRPNTGSYATDSGATVPVLRDFNMASRVGGTHDMGAVLP